MATRKPLEQRFWEKVERADGCWKWLAATNDDGYGVITVTTDNGKTAMLAHRLSWQLHHGPIPDGLDVCHTCDNPPCPRPDHLFLGTALDNIRDCVSKGRTNGAAKSMPGERHPMAKLTWVAVDEIRSAPRGYGKTKALCEKFGVGYSTISYIRAGKRWKESKRPC